MADPTDTELEAIQRRALVLEHVRADRAALGYALREHALARGYLRWYRSGEQDSAIARAA